MSKLLDRPRRRLGLLLGLTSALIPSSALAQPSVARIWNEEFLAAIQRDEPQASIHARNLFHLSIALWDAWAAYDSDAKPYLHDEKLTASDPNAARSEALSFAAYRILQARFNHSVGMAESFAAFGATMDDLGYDRNFESTKGDSPAVGLDRQGEVTAATDSQRATGSASPSQVPAIEVSQEGSNYKISQNADKGGSQLEPFSQRANAYLKVATGKVETPQERVRRSFEAFDLPEIYEMLEERLDSNGYLDLLNAICILESDKSKAISAVMAHMNRPVDWKLFKENGTEYEDWKYRYHSISSLGYLNSGSANDLLVSLLSEEKARKIVVEAAGSDENWVLHSEWREELNALKSTGRASDSVWIEHSVCMLRGGAAYGLLITLDESQFQHVENAYRAVRISSLHGQSVFDKAWENTLRNTIGRYRFAKDKGWNEAFKIVSEMDWESELALYMSYYPAL